MLWSWDLIRTVISNLIGVRSNYKYSYLIFITLVTKSHEPSSRGFERLHLVLQASP